ncbi:hypothetical protein J2S00_000550 [Caldalkalibacillus uzonensis]|uniref:Uncharacterized protein n=1 Tax=Caldalkalibacillus uzonensis TaxID=353224 RepID=A0ABU0CMY3_9BACI|nr:hypothetical protein [Caldalkalibacillus uzonensis]MDQ0337780.1 hypothetical protein [Caldalkalibacillus uzonensis]
MTDKQRKTRNNYERLSQFNNDVVNFNIPYIQMGEWMDVFHSHGYALEPEETGANHTGEEHEQSDLQ